MVTVLTLYSKSSAAFGVATGEYWKALTPSLGICAFGARACACWPR